MNAKWQIALGAIISIASIAAGGHLTGTEPALVLAMSLVMSLPLVVSLILALGTAFWKMAWAATISWIALWVLGEAVVVAVFAGNPAVAMAMACFSIGCALVVYGVLRVAKTG